MQPKPDCCPVPDPEVVHRLYGPLGPERDLRRCRSCGTYWRFDAEDRMNFSGGEDYCWEWWTRLTPAEAAALRGGGPGEPNPDAAPDAGR